jgi:lambda family phage tail tape measure protein
MQQNARAIDAMIIQMEEVNRNRREGYERTLEGRGSGELNRQRIQDQNSLIREFDREFGRVQKMAATGLLDPDAEKRAVEAIRAQLGIALADHQRYFDEVVKGQQNAAIGMSEALNNYLDKVRNVSEQSQRLMEGSFQRMEDALVDFVTTGKLNWKSLVDFMVAEITRMVVRQQITGPLAGAAQGGNPLGWLLGMMGMTAGAGIGYGAAGTAAGTAMVAGPGGMMVAAIANGAAFSGRGMEPFASGGVVSKATPFTFGRNRLGVMGEAGHEGVLPLARTAAGDLGVKVASQAPGGLVQNISITVNAKDAESFKRSEGQLGLRLMSVASAGSRFR